MAERKFGNREHRVVVGVRGDELLRRYQAPDKVAGPMFPWGCSSAERNSLFC